MAAIRPAAIRTQMPGVGIEEVVLIDEVLRARFVAAGPPAPCSISPAMPCPGGRRFVFKWKMGKQVKHTVAGGLRPSVHPGRTVRWEDQLAGDKIRMGRG